MEDFTDHIMGHVDSKGRDVSKGNTADEFKDHDDSEG